MSFVQFSDSAKTEFRLNAYQDKGVAMSALHQIRYRGGNTKTGLSWTSYQTKEQEEICVVLMEPCCSDGHMLF